MLSIEDFSRILTLNFQEVDTAQVFDPIENSISFKIHNGYRVKVKSCEEVVYEKQSVCHRVPQWIMKEHVFSYFSAFELFKLRGVNREWLEMVRSMYHKTFKREMFEQLMAADLCNEIEKEYMLFTLRNSFRQRIHQIMQAVYDLIQWDLLDSQILDGTIGIREEQILYCILKILGKTEELRLPNLQNIHQIEHGLLFENRIEIVQKLKLFFQQIFQNGFNFVQTNQIFEIRRNFLSSPNMLIESFSNQPENNKNSLVLIIYLKQLYFYALLKNYIFVAINYIQMAKEKLQVLSRQWPENKGFLDGSYKILLLKNVKIREGKIVTDNG